MVAFTSGKGGTGKSCLALNISIAAAQMGKKVLLVDLDVNLSNLHIMLNLTPRENLEQFFADKSLLADVIHRIDANLSCIFGSSDHPRSKLNPTLLDRLFKKLAEISTSYDLILLDTGSGTGEVNQKILTTATHNVIITNPEPTSVMDSYVVLKLLKSAGYKGKKLILVNKASDASEGAEAFQKLEQAASHFLNEEIQLAGNIEKSDLITNSLMKQNPVIFESIGTNIYNQIKQVTKSLLKIIQMANIAQ